MNKMTNTTASESGFSFSSLAGLGTPVLLFMMLVMMVLPLPAFVLDLLFTFNIALAIIVLLASVYSRRPLDFAVFPTVLLIATLLRLALNVASTRVVLLEGHEGTGAAGKVIQAFGGHSDSVYQYYWRLFRRGVATRSQRWRGRPQLCSAHHW